MHSATDRTVLQAVKSRGFYFVVSFCSELPVRALVSSPYASYVCVSACCKAFLGASEPSLIITVMIDD